MESKTGIETTIVHIDDLSCTIKCAIWKQTAEGKFSATAHARVTKDVIQNFVERAETLAIDECKKRFAIVEKAFNAMPKPSPKDLAAIISQTAASKSVVQKDPFMIGSYVLKSGNNKGRMVKNLDIKALNGMKHIERSPNTMKLLDSVNEEIEYRNSINNQNPRF